MAQRALRAFRFGLAFGDDRPAENRLMQPAAIPSIPMSSVTAIIVTFQPDLSALHAQLARLRPQVAQAVIVDNASGTEVAADLQALGHTFKARLLRNRNNLGIAAALNQGIAVARTLGATHVLLMDQDSLPAADMVEKLSLALARLQSQETVAAVGPVAEDLRTGEAAPFVRVGFPLNRKIPAVPGECVYCDFLITSGSLVPLVALDAIGGMDEALFIDNVDMEWSFVPCAACGIRAAWRWRCPHGPPHRRRHPPDGARRQLRAFAAAALLHDAQPRAAVPAQRDAVCLDRAGHPPRAAQAAAFLAAGAAARPQCRRDAGRAA
ncbi:glycosyltransferase family 2 protein [Solilutibacter oculi]|uniref:glycosyltransferase family 2 protein n=1 Tax=Solilutibacter oculi TaxID=2698682 RepID=UPI001F363411|nr:glycosyltransferase family 2 protein [Lysobacter oculi]